MTTAGFVPPDKWNQLLDVIESGLITSYVGGTFVRAKGGTILVQGNPPTAGLRLHEMSLGDFIPDPFKIVSSIMAAVTTELLSAVPTASQFAGVMSSRLVDAATSGADPSSAVGEVTGLFADAMGVLDSIADRVQEEIENINPIATALQSHFAEEDAKRPRNGDYIYTEEFGIIYTLFRQNDDGVPSGNTVFRVPFLIGEATWVAITTFPAPDLGALISSILGMALSLFTGLLAALVDGVIQAASAALKALFEALQEALEQIEDMLEQLLQVMAEIAAIWSAIHALQNSLSNVGDIVDGLSDGLDALQGAQDALQGAHDSLQTLVDGLKGQLDAAVTLEVIGGDGRSNIIKVLANTIGIDLKKTITWIDSAKGEGHSGTTLLFTDSHPHVEDVDWRTLYYISQSGKMMQAKVITNIAQGYPKEEALSDAMTLKSVEMCDDGEEVTKDILVKDVGDD